MENLRDKYRSTLAKIVASKDPSGIDVLNDAIADLRFRNEQLINQRDDLRDSPQAEKMRQALNDVAEEFRAAQAKTAEGAKARHWKNTYGGTHVLSALAGGVVGCLLTIGLIFLMQGTGLIDVAFGVDAQRRIKLDTQFLSDHATIPIADAYLRQAVKVVQDMQAKEPATLEKIAGKNFVSLSEIAPSLHKAMPAQLTKYSGIVVKANKTGYKVLLNWPLCTAAKWAKPNLIDPVRGTVGDHCSHFGYWNEAGAKF